MKGVRTLDLCLGKASLYQLSYHRNLNKGVLLHQDMGLVTTHMRHPVTIPPDVEFFLLRSHYFRDNSLKDGYFQAYFPLFCYYVATNVLLVRNDLVWTSLGSNQGPTVYETGALTS